MSVRTSLFALLVLLVGCTSEGYEVSITFDDPTLAETAQTVEVAFVATCPSPLGDAAVSPVRSSVVQRTGSVMELGEVPPGSYGLYARALGTDCAVVAAGCAMVQLEGGGARELTVELSAASGTACPVGTACTNDRCELNTDAGPPDDCPDGCDDGDDCTDGLCESGTCTYTTRDADQDGRGDAMCPEVGGVPADDCDDDDPGVFTGATELCNGADDDCDGSVDEDFDCELGATESCIACGDGARTCQTGTCTFGPCLPVADPALVASWTFDDEPDPNAIADATGDHPGIVVGDVATLDRGPFGCGTGFQADGSAPYGEIPHSPDFDLSSGSLRAWVRFDADGRSQGIFSRDASGTTMPGHLTIRRDSSDIVRARIQNLDGEVTRCFTTPTTGGDWHEVLVRWGAPDFELLVDGLPADDAMLCSDASNTGGIVGNMNPVVLGATTIQSDEGAATPVAGQLDGSLGHVELRSGRADPAAPEITGFVLLDSANDTELGALGDGAEIDSAAFPDISIRVNVDPITIAFVQWTIDGVDRMDPESNPPFTIAGDMAATGDIARWDVGPGTYEITATAFTSATVSGPPRTITVTIR